MPNAYHVSILSIREVHTLAGIWNNDSLRTLLELAEVDDLGDITDGDLLEMCLMVLQDLGNQKAGELVLEVVFGDRMRPGVRQNLVDDLQENEPWNDFADISQQHGIFIAVCLLHKAFPTRYGTPDAYVLRVRIQPRSSSGAAALEAARADWLIRLLACGMSEDSIVHRLFGDELKTGEFKDAPGLIWNCERVDEPADADNSRTFDITASKQLFSSLTAHQTFTV
ncbi:MAG: hypothetical protein WBN06_17390 [Lysobacterales bacterium]